MDANSACPPPILGPQNKGPKSDVAAGDPAPRLGGPEAVAASILGFSGRPRFISKAFLDSGGQEIFQNSRRHGCQYVFIVVDGMRSELRGKLTLKERTSIRARTAAGAPPRTLADSAGANES